SDGDGRTPRSPPGKRNEKEDIPLRHRPWPPCQREKPDVISDVPGAKGEKSVADPAPPGATCEPPDGHEHDHGRGLSNHFGPAKTVSDWQRIRLIGHQTVNECAEVKDNGRFDPSHCQRVNHDNEGA